MFVVVDKVTRRPLRAVGIKAIAPNEFALPVSHEVYAALVNDPFALSNYVVNMDDGEVALRQAPKMMEGFLTVGKHDLPDVRFNLTHQGVRMTVLGDGTFPIDYELRISLLEDGNPLCPVMYDQPIKHGMHTEFPLHSGMRSSSKPIQAFKLLINRPYAGFNYGVVYE